MITNAAEIRLLTIVLLWLGCTAAPLAAGTVFKWRDANGRIHYGDRPPANAASRSQRVPISTRPETDPNGDQRRALRNRLLKSYAHERAAKRAERAKRNAAREQNEAACARVRSRLAALQQAGGIFQTTADGQRIYFTDAQRARLMRETRDAVRQHCE